MGYMTADEAKQDYIAKMGEALGTQFSEFWKEVAYLHMKWQEYSDLFGTKNSRIDLVNEAAPIFFRVVQDVLLEDILLHIARLMDRPQRGYDKEVLTLRNLPKLVDVSFRTTVEALLKDVESKIKFCRDWRNRHIAHRNLALATNPSARPLDQASRKLVNEALDSIVVVLNAVSAHYRDSESFFRMGSRDGSAVSLLYVLDSGVRAETAREERLRGGKGTPEDYQPRDL
jgi:hypothetical protein